MINIRDLIHIDCNLKNLWAVKQGDNFVEIINEDLTLHSVNACLITCKKALTTLVIGKPVIVSHRFISGVNIKCMVQQDFKIAGVFIETKATKTWKENLKIYNNKQKNEKFIVKIRPPKGAGCILEILSMRENKSDEITLEINPILWL